MSLSPSSSYVQPISFDIPTIDEALKVVADNDVKLLLGFQRRFDSNFRTIREKVIPCFKLHIRSHQLFANTVAIRSLINPFGCWQIATETTTMVDKSGDINRLGALEALHAAGACCRKHWWGYSAPVTCDSFHSTIVTPTPSGVILLNYAVVVVINVTFY